ncbi:B3 domain-containing protein [Salix suchowensis]|nr:B3 domain-containing protein [Salix suchowensis]
MDKHQERFSMPLNQIKDGHDFLNETEMEEVRHGESMSTEVKLVELRLKDGNVHQSTMKLRRWQMKNTASYVLTSSWNDVLDRNAGALKVDDIVQVYSFRRDQKLWLVLIKMWILGNPIRILGSEFSNERAIYICNHASPIDIFLMMCLTPTGTIIWYPIFGQLYVLANNLRIDRTNPTAAIQSMKEVAHAVVKNNLSLGFVHLALQTRLPIVPMIFTGTHRAWRKGGLHVRPAPIAVNDYVRLLHDIYVENLPEAQMPLHYKVTRNFS